MKVTDIEQQGRLLLVNIGDKKTYGARSFVIGAEYAEIVNKYKALRPKDVDRLTDRFFITYRNGKCTHQVIGKNKFTKTPGDIAKYLKLPDARLYTGHSLRRSSASLLVNQGADARTIQQHVVRKSSSIAEGNKKLIIYVCD